MHDAENLIDIGIIEAISILFFQYYAFQFFQKLSALVQKHVKHAFCVEFFCHISSSS